MKKIISFSLWGDNPKYTVGAIENAKLAKTIYPDWTCRFYIDNTVPKEIINLMKQRGAEIYKYDIKGDWFSMFWRFLAISDDDVECMISRDCDSRISEREQLAVKEWLESDKLFHIMRDHPHHESYILAGMYGTKKIKDIISWKTLIDNYIINDIMMYDQDFNVGKEERINLIRPPKMPERLANIIEGMTTI